MEDGSTGIKNQHPLIFRMSAIDFILFQLGIDEARNQETIERCGAHYYVFSSFHGSTVNRGPPICALSR